MKIRRHLPSLLLNSNYLFSLAFYEMLISVFCKESTYFMDFLKFYFSTSSLPKTILLAHWISAEQDLFIYLLLAWCFFKAIIVFPRLCERPQLPNMFLFFIIISFKTFLTLLSGLFLKHKYDHATHYLN